MTTNNKAYKNAHKYFGLKKGDGLCLHHIDPTLRHTNPERYNEWRPTDLVVMSIEEHTRLHHIGNKNWEGKKHSEETRKKISTANRGKKRSEETKKKISSALKDRTFSEEHRKKLSKSHKDQIPWNKGKKLSEQTRAKISESLKGHTLSLESRKKMSESLKKPVAQYALNGELIKIWDSAKAAEVEGGFCGSTITKVCKGKLKTHKKCIWRYVND